ncbi:hypothetical protein Sango_2854100 [Sesamum angolense]|uniref:Reverse transcriptase n=1 Tax=Sesamum angolense TaxID=2727404 RepID=A0AAE1T703_9LAMI|nr:hypothetical protein Sango_2963600 [Sesamum angolense]KAK4382640.1 hypothetical protein Sango_2854100 [Sesamum angolense]
MSVKYLGLPLISSRLSLSNCRALLDKFDRRIQGWVRILPSFATRIQLIKSILMTLNTYWAMAFILPKGIIKEIEKRLRNFLWKGVTGMGYSKVAWPQVCNLVDKGGLGVRDIQSLNLALMSRQLWEVRFPGLVGIGWLALIGHQGDGGVNILLMPVTGAYWLH